ncbi:hypothetical protein QBC33DRAFT_539109 [Phialemonium atrogriseum]|uniref:Abscission/NoCut checkpoint regulator n=1 Tax=Phialemonium atrogriseum TaxID=1093897 RepID=A0AAJ0BYY3_9PEZI|nr:uncharacterized protein QBC33DRAFT_539109 [Phialemonium atrogriseum]KAK1767078.1 hypothetical protein QBC33DRAFT_539109 [Phialemonium atrogriseum]
MANTPPRSDRSLLERLNALKPTSVSLDREPISNTAQSDAALSRDDALTARLRTLRNLPSGGRAGAGSGSGSVSASPRAEVDSPGQNRREPGVRPSVALPPWAAPVGSGEDGGGGGDIDPLFLTDDAALDELLEGIIDFDISVSDDVGTRDFDPAAESKKVSEALERLKGKHSVGPNRGAPVGHSHDDESEGEDMAREIERILSQACDEAKVKDGEQWQGIPGQGESPDQPPADSAGPKPRGAESKSDEADGFSLPSVPSALADLGPPEAESESPDHQTRRSLDFEEDIATRMAALKGLGSGSKTNSFGLPSVPTFKPEDRPSAKIARKPGYTDEDLKTWCIVCLEDATVRCVGCDDDVYCARCWREMHVGPAAGYEERGHQWVKFERR